MEIYNLAAQSHVSVSFEVPEYTANADAIGALRILELLSFTDLKKLQNFIKLEHLKCLERLGDTSNEALPFYPRSPYGVAKVYAHWITVNYREAYDIFACNGIF